MRALLVTVLLLLLVGAGVAVLWFGGDDGNSTLAAPPGSATSTGEAADTRPATALPDGTVATRTSAVPIEAGDVADEPTACLRIIDHDTEQPCVGAIVRRVADGHDLAVADDRGLAALPLAGPAQLGIVHDGYLLRLAPTALGSTEREPQIVRLVRDAWSIVRHFDFVDAGGNAVDEAFVRFRPPADAKPARSPVQEGDAVRKRAWLEHSMLASRSVSRDVPVQLGRYDADRVHRLAGQAVVRFIVPGEYVLSAATTTGLVARATVRVVAGPVPEPLRVQFVAGAFVSGHIAGLDGTAIAGAEVTVQGSEPLGLLATTAVDGGFSLGPLAEGPVTLLVRHGTHEPIAHGPLAAPAGDVQVRLRALRRTALRGRVRARPGLAGITGATVVWQVGRGQAVSTQTGEDGMFELQVVGEIAARLLVQKGGYVSYSELVDPGAAFANYDLLPADTMTRLDKKLTATLEGVVLDENGWPSKNVAVRWRPERMTKNMALPGRRVLDGAILQLPLVTTTGEDGAFVLETTHFGIGRLTLANGDANGIEVVAVAGKTKNGLRLQR